MPVFKTLFVSLILSLIAIFANMYSDFHGLKAKVEYEQRTLQEVRTDVKWIRNKIYEFHVND